MQTQLLAMNLLPDYAIIAAIVVIAHWVWLFGLKNKFKPAVAPQSSKKPDIELSADKLQVEEVQNDNLISPSGFTNFFASSSSTSSEELKVVPTVDATPSRETILKEKYAGVDMVDTLDALLQGKLTLEMQKEIQELAILTLSTEAKHPYPMDLDS